MLRLEYETRNDEEGGRRSLHCGRDDECGRWTLGPFENTQGWLTRNDGWWREIPPRASLGRNDEVLIEKIHGGDPVSGGVLDVLAIAENNLQIF